MAITGSRLNSLTYGIIYGLFGRPALTRKLERLLNATGLRSTQDFEHADILIAHSAGCWLVPETAKARLIILNGVPLADNQNKAYCQANVQIYKQASVRQLVSHFSGNIFSALRYPWRNLSIIRMAKRTETAIPPEAMCVFITNRDDPWPRSKKLDELLNNKDWAFISLPGPHNYIWHHPEHYAAIINHYARLLAKTDG